MVGDKSDSDFGSIIKRIIAAKGISREQLAFDVGVSLKTVNRWINDNHTIRPGNARALKHALGLNDQEWLRAFGIDFSQPLRTRGDYTVCSFATAKRRLGSFEALAEAIANVEVHFPVPTQENEYGTDEQWMEILKISPDTGGVLIYQDNDIVGYWQCLPVKDYIHKEFLEGKNVNQKISANDVIIISGKGNYKLIFVSLFILEDHRTFQAQKIMREDFLDFLYELAEDQVFFDSIVANITGVQALNLCENFGFRFVMKHPIHKFPIDSGRNEAEIYELKLPSDGKRIFSFHPHLEKLYRKK